MEGEAELFTRATNVQNWQLILAFLLPLLIAVINRRNWERSTKAVVMFVVALVATTITMYLNGDLDDVTAQTYVGKVLFVIVATIAFYNGLWKPTQVAPTIEDNT